MHLKKKEDLTESEKRLLVHQLKGLAKRHFTHYKNRSIRLPISDMFAFISNRDRYKLVHLRDIIQWMKEFQK